MAIPKKSKRSAAWGTAVKADRDEWRELLGANPTDKTLAHLGISRSCWGRIIGGKSPSVPVASYRLARWIRYGELSDVFGGPWRDFFLLGDGLLLPGMKRPLAAREMRAMWHYVGEVARLRSELAFLQHEREDLSRVDVRPLLDKIRQRAAAK